MELDPFFGRLAVFVSLLAYVVIRWPHGNRYKSFTVLEDHQGRLEVGLLIGALLGTTVIPLLWVTTPLLAFADYRLYAVPYALGLVLMLCGLWLFHRSHKDLGLNWSVTLQIREDHKLITHGVYSAIRHPMYSAMFLLGLAQLLFCPNWVAGPAYLVSFGLLYLFRVRAEERMLIRRFGEEYEAYVSRTGRLAPRLFD